MTTVAVNTYTHSVTYVADNILKSIKDIIRMSGMDPSKFAGEWNSNLLAIKTWLGSQDLERAILEVFNSKTGGLIVRWDIDIVYSWAGGGGFWTDTEALRYHIKKSGVAPGDASYELLLKTKPGRPDVAGWGSASYRSIDGFVRHSIGSTIDHSGLGGSAAYWRRT
ncbi:HORMA domain containing protein [Rhizobium leguminosarum]|uniref:HORMA domain containing protein n=1 Tax=Rhizobium leguminosarum TaxID=384 RepID=UPI0024B3796B|nr:HORMA domain containing protein [Rhizobium leguminosarum]WHO84111.1 HORMA domain containing protein [Rhizobium leguminosarum]